MEGAYYLNTTQLHDNVGDFFFLYIHELNNGVHYC